MSWRTASGRRPLPKRTMRRISSRRPHVVRDVDPLEEAGSGHARARSGTGQADRSMASDICRPGRATAEPAVHLPERGVEPGHAETANHDTRGRVEHRTPRPRSSAEHLHGPAPCGPGEGRAPRADDGHRERDRRQHVGHGPGPPREEQRPRRDGPEQTGRRDQEGQAQAGKGRGPGTAASGSGLHDGEGLDLDEEVGPAQVRLDARGRGHRVQPRHWKNSVRTLLNSSSSRSMSRR